MTRVYKILGGPGCGKTTEILNILGQKFREKLHPNQVLMIGFAKATVKNLREKCMDELKFSEEQADTIKTIHKYCLDHLTNRSVFTKEFKRDFKSKLKIDPSNWRFIDGDFSISEEDCVGWSEVEDKKLGTIFKLIGYARHKLISDTQEIIKFAHDSDNLNFARLKDSEIEWVYESYLKYKKANTLIDFEDMLSRALPDSIVFQSYDTVMVDEAQDLTDLEWAIIDKIAKKSNNLYLVGDDDQGIYGWKGSEVSKFQTWPCDEKDIRFLKKSYRLPTNIHHFVTTEILPEIHTRMGNTYTSSGKGHGSISTLNDLERLKGMIRQNSSIIFCARTWSNCKPFTQFLMREGIQWKQKSKDNRSAGLETSINANDIITIHNWQRLRSGRGIKGKDVIHMYGRLIDGLLVEGKKTYLTKKETCPKEFADKDKLFTYKELKDRYYLLADIDKPWHEVFYFETTRIKAPNNKGALFDDNDHYNEYVRLCWEKDANLDSNILVSTIHGVKGMEREVVIINSDWGPMCYKAFQSGIPAKEDEETRVCYVGATRAKQKLIIYEGQQEKGHTVYRFPLLNIGRKYEFI